MLLCFLLLSLSGCQSSPAIPSAAPSTQVQIDAATKEVGEARSILTTGDNPIVKMPDATPLVKQRVLEADSHLTDASTSLAGAKKSSVADAREVQKQTQKVAELEKADPVKTWLNLIGIGSIVLGGAMLIASIFVHALFALPWVRSVGAGTVVFGFLLVTIAHFLTPIYLIVGGTVLAAAVGGGFWLWTHRKIVAAKVGKFTVVGMGRGTLGTLTGS